MLLLQLYRTLYPHYDCILVQKYFFLYDLQNNYRIRELRMCLVLFKFDGDYFFKYVINLFVQWFYTIIILWHQINLHLSTVHG